jgi:hypothetical protein
MPIFTLDPVDNKEHIYFSAPGQTIEISIPVNNGAFVKTWSIMVSLTEGIKLQLVPQVGVTLEVDQDSITRPNDLFYIINVDGLNTWKAIRAGNFALTTSNRELINAPKELDTGSPIYQFIGPIAASQDIILPNPPATNDRYIIKNIFQDSFDLRIKETLAGPTIISLGPSSLRYIAECLYDGVEWQVLAY